MPEAPAGVRLAREEAVDEPDKKALDIIFSNALAFRPYLAPPGVPAPFADALRAAFMKTMADPEFRAHMERARLGVTPMAGPELQTLIASIYEADAGVVKRVRELTTP
jgi:tripartite-type tricarboxylate transporter receptor subunit TctC